MAGFYTGDWKDQIVVLERFFWGQNKGEEKKKKEWGEYRKKTRIFKDDFQVF